MHDFYYPTSWTIHTHGSVICEPKFFSVCCGHVEGWLVLLLKGACERGRVWDRDCVCMCIHVIYTNIYIYPTPFPCFILLHNPDVTSNIIYLLLIDSSFSIFLYLNVQFHRFCSQLHPQYLEECLVFSKHSLSENMCTYIFMSRMVPWLYGSSGKERPERCPLRIFQISARDVLGLRNQWISIRKGIPYCCWVVTGRRMRQNWEALPFLGISGWWGTRQLSAFKRSGWIYLGDRWPFFMA